MSINLSIQKETLNTRKDDCFSCQSFILHLTKYLYEICTGRGEWTFFPGDTKKREGTYVDFITKCGQGEKGSNIPKSLRMS